MTINGFHRRGRDISAQEMATTKVKKIANWTVGKSMTASGEHMVQRERRAPGLRRGKRAFLLCACKRACADPQPGRSEIVLSASEPGPVEDARKGAQSNSGGEI